jgi:hypothetical protein
MAIPTRERLERWAKGYTSLWNAGDKRAWVANWKAVAPGDFRMVDPVGTPEKRGFEECAAKPFDLFQPGLELVVPDATKFICANEVAWVMENHFTVEGELIVMRSIEEFRFDADGSVVIRTFYDVPKPDSALGRYFFSKYLPGIG